MKKKTSSGETMNRRDFNKLLSAAMAGMMSAGALAGCKGNGAKEGTGTKPAGGGGAAAAKHECAGKNECKGQGGCKTGDAGCAGKNTCKGKGGCAVPAKH